MAFVCCICPRPQWQLFDNTLWWISQYGPCHSESNCLFTEFFLYISSMGWKIKVWEPTCAPVATRKMEKKFNLWDNSWRKEACLLCLLTEFRFLSLGTVLKGKVGQKRSLFMKGDWSPMHARTISARAYCRVYVSLTDFVGHTTTSRQLGQPVSFSYNACYFLRVNFFCMYSS